MLPTSIVLIENDLYRYCIFKIRKFKTIGITPEEYLLELISQKLDPREKAREFTKAAISLLEQAREELEKEDLRQVAEKIWAARALAVKAFVYWREGRRLSSHKELWEYKDVIVKELGEWVRESWFAAISMHICYYEEWCTKTDIEKALKTSRKWLGKSLKR